MRRIHPLRLVSSSTSRVGSLQPVPLLGVLLFLACGCSSTHQVAHTQSDGYSRVTEAAYGKTARVHFRDGRTMKLEKLYVDADSTTGIGPHGTERAFSTSTLWKVELVNRGVGFLQGAGAGAAGPLGGALLVQLQGDGLGTDLATVAGLALSVPGALIGGVVGAIRGHRTTYFVEAPPPTADSAVVAPRSKRSKNTRHK
jgi:hypothetical protein